MNEHIIRMINDSSQLNRSFFEHHDEYPEYLEKYIE